MKIIHYFSKLFTGVLSPGAAAGWFRYSRERARQKFANILQHFKLKRKTKCLLIRADAGADGRDP